MDRWIESACASLYSQAPWVSGFNNSIDKVKFCAQQSLLSMRRMNRDGEENVPVIFEARKQHWIPMMVMIFITQCPWESKGTFFFLLCSEQNCRDKQTLPCKVKTQHLRCVLTYWFSLAAIGRGSKEDEAMCAGPRELGEIQAALCTPREWGLAYIECLCCRIESVEHLCLNSLTVKLGLTKNPSYTNRKWSRAFFLSLSFFLHKTSFCWAFLHDTFFLVYWWVSLLYM